MATKHPGHTPAEPLTKAIDGVLACLLVAMVLLLFRLQVLELLELLELFLRFPRRRHPQTWNNSWDLDLTTPFVKPR